MKKIFPKQNITKLTPYTCARDLFKTGIFLDANENYQQWLKVDWSKMNNLNRYPDSSCNKLRENLINKYIKTLNADNIFVGRGSDEIIDLLIRSYVNKNESIMVMNPSYSVYQVQANMYGVGCKSILLNPNFSLDLNEIEKNIKNVKIIFLCSPNNPTGSLVNKVELKKILTFFKGLIVIDEAYIEFAGCENSFIGFIKNYPNIVILRTFSKAWGLAGIRVGYAVADRQIVQILLKVKDSYNVTAPSQEIAIQALDQLENMTNSVNKILKLKDLLIKELKCIGCEVKDTKANFILMKIPNATDVYKILAKKGMILRDRSNLPYLENTIRITVGSKDENKKLVKILKKSL